MTCGASFHTLTPVPCCRHHPGSDPDDRCEWDTDVDTYLAAVMANEPEEQQ